MFYATETFGGRDAAYCGRMAAVKANSAGYSGGMRGFVGDFGGDLD